MSQQLSSLGGDGPNRFGQFDFEEEEIPEGKNETAIYILKSYSSGIESRIKDEFASWEVFFITSEEDFTESGARASKPLAEMHGNTRVQAQRKDDHEAPGDKPRERAR